MNCTDARPLLDLLCDGALEAKDSALVLDHLRSCQHCQNEWTELEHLHAEFKSAKNSSLQLPDGMMERISERLKKEAAHSFWHAPGSRPRVISMLAIAVTALLIFLTPTTFTEKVSLSQVSADSLIDDLRIASAFEPVDRSLLPSKAGYEFKYLHLPEWHLEKSSLYKSSKTPAIARFDFVRDEKDAVQQLTCYQSTRGVISSIKGSFQKKINGKDVYFGKRGAFQFAFWSQNGRDYLFVTSLDSYQLEEIVRNT